MSAQADSKHNVIHDTVKQHDKKLLRFIRRRVGTDADAEDILQDVWYNFTSVINTEPIERIGAWLFRVARNKIIDKYKKKTELPLENEFYDGEDEEDDGISFKDILLVESTTPETEYLKDLFWQQLFAALEELPEEQKQVFIWHELEDISFQEISEMTGEKVNTLLSRKRYAVMHLRKRLKQLYEEMVKYK